MSFIIRPMVETDIDDCIQLFINTIHFVNSKDYTQEQVNAWAPKDIKKDDRWCSLLSHISFVAEQDQKIVGFAVMDSKGYLDLLFVHYDFQHQGIATALFHSLEDNAIGLDLKAMTTEASLTAKPFFEKCGFLVIKKQEKEVRGLILTNFIMKKSLRS